MRPSGGSRKRASAAASRLQPPASQASPTASARSMSLFTDPLFVSVAIGHLMIDTFNASRPVLLTYLGLGETAIATISTIYIWAGALTQPVFGWLSDRIGPRLLAAGGLLWMAVFYSGAVLIPGSLGLACLVAAALGSSAFHPVGAVQATIQGRERLRGRETTAASFFFTAGQSGHFIGPILTGLILSARGLPGMMMLPAVAIPISLALARQLRSNHPHPQPAAGQGRFRLQAAAGFIVALAIVATCQSWAQANIVNLMPKYVKDLGQTATVYGAFAGLFMGGSALGNVIGGSLGDTYPKRYVVAISLFLAALPVFAMSRIGWSPWLYLLVPLAGSFTGAVHSNMVVLAQRMIPGGMALASGLALGFIFSAGAFGLLFTGRIAEQQGFPTVLLMTTALVLAAAPVALFLREAGHGRA